MFVCRLSFSSETMHPSAMMQSLWAKCCFQPLNQNTGKKTKNFRKCIPQCIKSQTFGPPDLM